MMTVLQFRFQAVNFSITFSKRTHFVVLIVVVEYYYTDRMPVVAKPNAVLHVRASGKNLVRSVSFMLECEACAITVLLSL
jgi:hypothetical protein